MSCNNKTSFETDIQSSSGAKTAIEYATASAFTYPEYFTVAMKRLRDPSVTVPSVIYGIDNLVTAIDEYIYPLLINSKTYETVIPRSYPSLDDRTTENKPRITYTELADFLDFTAYDDVETFTDKIVKNPRTVLKQLDNYYEDQMSGSSVSLCSLLENPFAGIEGIVDKITDMIGTAQNILNLIPSIASRLKAFAETMKELASNVFETMKGVVSNISDKITDFVNMPSSVIAGLASHFSKQFASLQSMLSDINLKNIQENIDKFVTKAVKQFEKILDNPQVVLYLLYQFCKTSSSIESSIKNPVKAFQDMMSNSTTEYNTLKVKSAVITEKAINAGRPVVTEGSAEGVKTRRAASHNTAVATESREKDSEDIDTKSKIIVKPTHSKHPDPKSWSNLKFEASVINNTWWNSKKKYRTYAGGTIIPAETGYGPAIGYYGMKLEVLEMLNEVGRQMGTTLTVNSAFRHEYYNKHIGSNKTSQHVQRNALDVRMAGINRKTFCALAWKVGFRGFGGYSTFIHVDVGPQRSWGRGNLPAGVWR